ncbi:MAG: DMT family transporter, partial [Bacteroidales bacterium]
MKQKDWYYYLLMVCTTLLWGSSFVLTKQLLNYFSPISLIYLRVVIASLLFSIICLIFFRNDLKIKQKDIKTLLAFSCFEPFLYFILETYGLKHSDPSVVSIIIATIPMFVAFLSIYYFKENFTKINLLGVFISFIGILVMLLPSIHDEAFSSLGIACAFGAVLSAVGYSFFIRKFPSNYNPVVVI